MGVDRDKINTDEEYLKKHGAGQSDTLFLAAVNTSTGKISLINVPRDIMAYVKTYDENGKYSGSSFQSVIWNSYRFIYVDQPLCDQCTE